MSLQINSMPTPFFARYLEGQDLSKPTEATHAYPSDSDTDEGPRSLDGRLEKPRFVTMAYPSDTDSDTFTADDSSSPLLVQTRRHPSNTHDDLGGDTRRLW